MLRAVAIIGLAACAASWRISVKAAYERGFSNGRTRVLSRGEFHSLTVVNRVNGYTH